MRDIARDEFGYPMTGLGQPATSLISTKATGQQLPSTAAPTMPGRGVPNSRGINELTSLRDFSALPMGRTQNPTPLPMSSMTNPNSVGTVGGPGVGVKLNSGPALQIGGTDRYGNPYQPMGPVPRYTPYELLDMYSEEKARDYIGRISDDDARKIDPRGKQGLLDYLVESLQKRKIPKPPRQFEWRQGQQAPQRDWEAILDFQNFVGMRSGRTRDINVDKALQNPGMADQSFGGSLTLKQVTPEMIAALKAEGYNVEQADYMKNAKLGMLKTGSGSAALNLYKTLKAKGYDLEIQPFKQVSYRGMYG
jgi:hypothetical protein